MRYCLIIIILFLTVPSFCQVDDSVVQDFFNKRAITPKLEILPENIQLISQDVGIWAPEDLKALLQDSIVNRGDIGLVANEKKKVLEETLDKRDFDFIDEQVRSMKKSAKWTTEVHKSKTLITLDSYEKGKMWIYTVPIFNKTLDYCIIKISYYCGNLCAFSSIYSFKKSENKLWEIDKKLYSYLPFSDYQLLPKEVLDKDKIEVLFCNSNIDSLYIGKQVEIIDQKQVYDYLCRTSNEETDWPSNEIKRNSGVCSNDWNGLENGRTATIVWRFNNFKSQTGDNVYLMKLDGYYAPIGCSGIQLLSDE